MKNKKEREKQILIQHQKEIQNMSIECDSDEKFRISSFPDIYFENKEFGAVFTLTYEDLFIYDEESKTIGYLL